MRAALARKFFFHLDLAIGTTNYKCDVDGSFHKENVVNNATRLYGGNGCK